ncbi:MAG: Flp family type IVb pilin [Paracraurococcus sp.]|jgi:pilus assembly protein Flp/PilA
MSLYLLARSLVTDRKGVTALEYGLIAALIAAVIVGAVTTLGSNASGVFQYVADKLVHP